MFKRKQRDSEPTASDQLHRQFKSELIDPASDDNSSSSDDHDDSCKRACQRDFADPPTPPAQVAKRAAKALNFSIESIMQQSEQPAPSVLTGAGASLLASLASQHAQVLNGLGGYKSQFRQLASPVEHQSTMQQQQQHGDCGSPISLGGGGGSSRASSALNSRSPSPVGGGGGLQQGQFLRKQQAFGANKSAASGRLAAGASPSDAGTSGAHASGSSSRPGAPNRLSKVGCQLDNKEMWDKFHSLNTEMIITKTGRRMFPVMKVQFSNLDPNTRYAVSMDIVPVDNKRYRYAYHKSCWQQAGKADPSAEPRLYPHPDSPFTGDLLARQVISFEKVKLTNNEMDKSGHIILNSMHKYQPRVHLIELKSQQPISGGQLGAGASGKQAASDFQHLQHHHQHQHSHHQHNSNNNNQQQQQQQQPQFEFECYRTFVFPETVFTAVTAYQNQLITKMKIDKNPFAKGFRDSSRLSDLDRNDPFDYMGPMGPGGRFLGQTPPGAGNPLDMASAHMDAYQLLASAANNPWYSAAAAAAAAAGGAPSPFANQMGACSTAQAAQFQTQMWLAAFSACLNNQTNQTNQNNNNNNNANGANNSTGAGPAAAGLPPLPAGQMAMASINANMRNLPNLLASIPMSGSSPTQHHHHNNNNSNHHHNHHHLAGSTIPESAGDVRSNGGSSSTSSG